MATQASDTTSKTRARGASDELAIIAQRAQAFTNASGTAIALIEGNINEITCRARSGTIAPEVGTPMRVEGSFTGLCIHSGKELRCDDAETDTRLDTAALRNLGIRSLVVTPIKEENRVVGVLMVFAPTPHAFTITHVAVLKTMADQISALLQKYRKAKEEGVAPEPVRPSAPSSVAMPKPVAAAPVVPPPVVIKPSAPAARAASFPVVSKVEPFKSAPAAEGIPRSALPARPALPAKPVKPVRKDNKRDHVRAERRESFGAVDLPAEEQKKAGNPLLLGVVAVVVIAAAAGGMFVFRKQSKPPASSAIQNPPEGGNSAADGQPAAIPGAAGTSPAFKPGGGRTGTGANSPFASNPRMDISGAERTDRPSPRDTTLPIEPARPSPTAVAISTGTSKIAVGGGSDQSSPDVTPILNMTPNPGGGLNALTRPVPSSTPSMITQSALESAQVLKRVPPVYPAIARARRLSGTVTIRGIVGTDGKIRKLELIGGPPIFRDSAFEALRQWQFRPARLNGQLIDQTQEIRVAFTP